MDTESAAVSTAIATTRALRWLITYLAHKGDAAHMLQHLEATDWNTSDPMARAVADELKLAIIRDLREIVDA